MSHSTGHFSPPSSPQPQPSASVCATLRPTSTRIQTGLWWVLVGFGGLWRALAGFGGFYRVLSGFIGFYPFLSGFIGFYPALFIEPPQLAATAALLLFPAMATFRYKQASTISSVFQPRESSSIVEGSLVPADVARKEGDVARNSARNRTVRGATEGWHATWLSSCSSPSDSFEAGEDARDRPRKTTSAGLPSRFVLGPIRVCDSQFAYLIPGWSCCNFDLIICAWPQRP